MKRYICTLCGYVYEGDAPPAICPLCGVGPERFIELPPERPAKKPPVAG